MASVELLNIQKHYGKTKVLRDIFLSVEDGEFLTLVGPSGCGKSTLLRIIAGLEAADGGEVRINGKNVAGVRPKDRNVAKVFQSYALYPHLTAFDNIATPLRMRRLTSMQRFPLLGRLMPETRRIERDIRGEVEQVAAMLRMSALLDRKPGQLSGGQRQRVALGRAMVRHPAVFLMDEPLSNLDSRHRVQMRAEIMSLHRQLGTTFIYVTHDQAEAMTMSDRVAVMMEGELMQISEPEQLYTDPDDLRVAEMIGTPQINVVAIEKMAQHSGLYLAFPPDAASMAFRPEGATIRKPLGATLNGIVSMTEHLGADIFVHIKLGDDAGTIIVRTKPDEARHDEGALVGVSVDSHKILWFDADRKRIHRHAVKRFAA